MLPGDLLDAGGTSIHNQFKINMLIRTTLIALSQANQTGNHSVLHDLGTPQFQATNMDARLAEIFSDLRHRNFRPVADPFLRSQVDTAARRTG